ncbi:hypothetical protein V492_07629 [Pseudogymnoascus sp. VKM F-4246]|nr:hypothetical protein V492_07629 [Pseudogymnoascus sp. VKM F-4246]
MAGDKTSPFEGPNANVPPKVVSTLSREQFLYSLARTPTPTRFQRPRTNPQSISNIHNPFQARGIRDGATGYPHNTSPPYELNLIEGLNSKPPGRIFIKQADQNLGEVNNKPRDSVQNEATAYFQTLAPEIKSGSTLCATYIPTPASERRTVEKTVKTAIKVIASENSSAPPPSPSRITSVATVEPEEYTPFTFNDESGYDSNSSSGEESGSLYTNANIFPSDDNESSHATVQSTGGSFLQSNSHIRESPICEQDGSSTAGESFGGTDANQISPGPLKKRPKRPIRSGSETLAQDVTFQATQQEIVEQMVPEQMCRTFDQLQLTEEKAMQEGNSEFGELIFDDDSFSMESQPIAPETPLLSIRQKRFPESSPHKPRKKPKTYPNTKMMSSKIHFKDIRLISRASAPQDCPKPIPTRLDFCDGFVGEESQPIVCTKATSRPRRLPRPGVLRRLKGYACQLPLVRSRTFGDEPHLQNGRRNPSTSTICQPSQTTERITTSSYQVSVIDTEKGESTPKEPPARQIIPAYQIPDADMESMANYESSSIIEDADIAMVSSPQLEEPGIDMGILPVARTPKRRVTFNEDVKVIRQQQVILQQLSMVSAPAPESTTSSDDESNYDRMDEEDEETHSEKSDSNASESGSEDGSGVDERSIEPSSPRHSRVSINTTLPSTPIRRWSKAEAEDSPSDGGAESEMLDDEMILDDTASVISNKYQVSDAVHLWGEDHNYERLNWNPSCPLAPRRQGISRQNNEANEDICASPSPKAPPWKKTVNNIRLNQSKMDWVSTQPATPVPDYIRYHREPSIELGNPDWPPRSFYSQSIMDTQASIAADVNQQFKQLAVADVPSYFSAASQSLSQSPYKPVVPPMRSKSMPSRSRYFNRGQHWDTDESILNNLTAAKKNSSFMGSQDEKDTSLRALTTHISIGTLSRRIEVGDPTFQVKMVRLKNRYLLVNILYPEATALPSSKVPDVVAFNQPTTDDLTPQLLIKAIREAVLELFGDYGSGAIAGSLMVKYLSPATSTFIIRVTRAHYRIAWAALSMMNTVPVKEGKKCVYRVVRVSGTIRKAEEEAIRRAREMMLRAKRELGDQSAATLESILGKPKDIRPVAVDSEVLMLDASDDDPADYGSDSEG